MAFGLQDSQTGSGASPPVIASVESSASYSPSTIAPGELITIFGTNLGPATPAGTQLDPSGNVTTSVDGTQVFIDGAAAPVLFASQTQVNAVVPFGISSESAEIEVVFDDQQSDAFSIPVQGTAPGMYSADSSGTGQALAINSDGSMNDWETPAARNSVITVYATGAGQTSPPSLDGSLATADKPRPPALPVTATVGGIPAQVLYAAGSPGSVNGVLQVNLVIPPDVESGPSVPVVLTVGDGRSQDGLTLAIAE
jgi:uncharacterized protein (TIGR03437 family)